MEPKFKVKIRFVKVAEWDCGVAEHHHKTKQVAIRCVDKQSHIPKRRNRWTNDALLELLKRYREGETTTDAAQRLKVSRQRVHDLIRSAEWLEEMLAERDALLTRYNPNAPKPTGLPAGLFQVTRSTYIDDVKKYPGEKAYLNDPDTAFMLQTIGKIKPIDDLAHAILNCGKYGLQTLDSARYAIKAMNEIAT